MKNFIKSLTASITALLLFLGTQANAQSMPANPLRFGIGAELGAATGNLSNTFAGEFGGTARVQYSFSNSFGIMLTSGYYNYFADKNNNAYTVFGKNTYDTRTHNLGIIPVKLGFKAYLTKSYYFSAEGGVGFETSYNEDKKLILSPGLGWANNSWDVSLRYENFSGQSNNYGLVGLRLAYGFKL